MRTRRLTQTPYNVCTADWSAPFLVLLFVDAADHFIAVFHRLRIRRSDRTGEIRAPCRNRRVGRDASGFCERTKYSDPLEARS